MVAKVPIRQPEHRTVAQGMERLRRSRLGNACAAATGFAEGRHGDRGGTREGGVRGRREIHVKLEEVQVARCHHLKIEVGLAGRRRRSSVEVRGQETVNARILLNANGVGRSATQHRSAVKGARVLADDNVSYYYRAGRSYVGIV